MIYLLSGVPRSGKTLKAVTLLKNYIDENNKLPLDKQRQIYSNIDGLIFDEVLPLPDDYRATEHRSIFFIDEAQLIDIYSSSSENKENEIVRSLSVHGHYGYDFYFITQDPARLSKHVVSMVSHHFHFSRVLNGNQAKFYYWTACTLNPNAPSNRRNALDTGIFFYPKDAYKFYVSSVDHTNIKMRIPRKFWYMLFFLVCVISLAVYLVKHYLLNSFSSLAANSTSGISNSIKGLSNEKNNFTSASINNKSLISNASSAVSNTTTIQPKYNANEPFKTEYETINNNFPVLAGAIILNSKCIAYSQQGTKLDLKKKDCLKVANGDMPFNPFKQQNIQQQTTNSNINNNSTITSVPDVKRIDLKFKE
jgi:zona occludens toxin